MRISKITKLLFSAIFLIFAAGAHAQQTIDPRLLPPGVPQQIQVDGVNLPPQPTVNFQISTDIDPVAAGGFIQWIIRPGAVTDAMIAAAGITTRSKLPSQIAYEDEANTFGGAVTIGGTGSFSIAGGTSGLITIGRQAAAGTYNFNLPTSAGTAGQALLSGGGGSAPMTWGNPVVIVDQAGAYVWTGTHSWRDGNFAILGSADQTKGIKFEVDGLPTATTRTYTTPNANTNLLGGSDIGVSVLGTAGTTAYGQSLLGAADAAAARTLTGAAAASGTTLSGSLSFTGILRAPSISTSQNNYNPTGCNTAGILYLTASAPVNITGLDCGLGTGRTIFIYNAGASVITLVNASGSSNATMRYAINANIPLAQNQGIVIQYDSDVSSTVWRAASGISGAGGQAADNDLTAISALSGTGFAVRTGTDTWALQPAARTDIGNTWTAGAQNMAAAASFSFPQSAGAAPTAENDFRYDTTSDRLVSGDGAATKTYFARNDSASLVANAPAGNVTQTNVQAAINQLDTLKQTANTNLTTLSGYTASTVLDHSVAYCADAGSTDTYACTNAAVTASGGPIIGALYVFKANTVNTGPASINFGIGGAKILKKFSGGTKVDLTDGDIPAGCNAVTTYDGTDMQFLVCASGGGGAGTITGPVSTNDCLTKEGTGSTNITCSSLTDDGAGTISYGNVSGNRHENVYAAVTGVRQHTLPDLSGTIVQSTGTLTTGNSLVSSAGLVVDGGPRYKSCQIENDTGATVLADANISGRCDVDQASTVVEIAVYASGGTPSVLMERWRPNGGAVADLTTSTFATAASGAYRCTKIAATAGIAGITCTNTLQNTALNAGDVVRVKSATAGGVATWHHVKVTFSY